MIETNAEYILRCSTPEPNSGCWLWDLRWLKNGYGQASKATLRPRVQTAHRLSYAAFNGPIPEGLCVLHRCDTRACVNPDHLFLGTKRDNTQDMIRKGRRTQTRLTEAQVAEIRASAESSRAIGRRFQYDAGNIRAIRARRLWK